MLFFLSEFGLPVSSGNFILSPYSHYIYVSIHFFIIIIKLILMTDRQTQGWQSESADYLWTRRQESERTQKREKKMRNRNIERKNEQEKKNEEDSPDIPTTQVLRSWKQF